MSDKKKRQNHVVLEIINLPSSARNFIGGQFKYLYDHGYEMHLICSEDDLMAKYARDNHVNYYPVILARTLSPLADIKALFKIYRYIRQNHIDTVIAHQAKARLLGTTAAFLAGVPNRIVFAHGVLFETLKGIKRRLVILMDKIVATMAHKTVCVSQSVANIRLKYKIEKASQQFFLGAGTCGGIDTQTKFNPEKLNIDEQAHLKKDLGISEKDFVIGFCGRLVRDKGILELVDAFRLLKERRREHIKLMIIGNKENRNSISEKLNDFIDSTEDIIHMENVPHDKIYRYFSLFDVLILPSYREGFGMVTIECGALKVPAIVSRSTGCIDSIVENRTGLFCDISAESICSQVEFMIDNPYKRIKMGENAREWIVEKFDSSVVWPHVIDVIEA